MPRRSGGGGGGGWRSSGRSSGGGGSWLPWSSSRSSPRPAADKPKKSPPKPASPAPPPAPVQSQPAAGGLASSFADGMAFGSGNAVGHRAVDAVLGPRVIRYEVTEPSPSAGSTTVATSNSIDSGACGAPMKAFQECLNVNGSDLSKCQFYMDMLCECRRNPTTGLIA